MRTLVFFLLTMLSAAAAQVGISLTAPEGPVRAGSSFEASVNFKIPEGLYVYYRDPGQTGLPTEVSWRLPEGFSVKKASWPPFERKEEAGLEVNAYPRSFSVAFEISVPASWEGKTAEIAADASWLECGSSCVPGSASAGTTLKTVPAGPGGPQPREAQAQDAAAGGGGWGRLMLAAAGAFFGGIILNLMPCVFPVIGLKVLAFAKDAGKSRAKALENAAFYSLGVVASFLALAGALVWFKAVGDELGWGFQLQEPLFVALLVMLFCAMALSFAGVFEIGAEFTRLGGAQAGREGRSAAALSGVLAVAVASPCTAPFMGSALGFALASDASWFDTAAIFASLGAGMAAPYVILSAIPAAAKRMPKPGVWMETFKQFLAFPMFATAIWLLWVFSKQRGADMIAELLFGVLSMAFGLWIFGKYSAPFHRAGTRIAAYASLAVLGLFGIYLAGNAAVREPPAAAHAKWSPAMVESLRRDGKIVYVDFTASWCLTCIANKKAVLDLESTRELFRKNNVAVLVGDWTDKNPEISRELQKFGRSGVPLNIIYPADPSRPPIVLPEILTRAALIEAIDKARK